MIISDSKLYGLPTEILAADRGKLDTLAALCDAGYAEARAVHARAFGRRAALYGSLAFGFLFLVGASLYAVRAIWPSGPILVFWIIALAEYWLLHWLFNTHDRLNEYAARVSEECQNARRRRDAIGQCVSQVIARTRICHTERDSHRAT